jgi:predicted unusual protein kinase regulating ubiquinone biosynthesis (AarF/ABC1/UbiB family)
MLTPCRCAFLQACATQVFVNGLFNADPHSGNILVQVADDGTVRPVLLDFGTGT